jgi:hypothetical protein
MAGTIKIVFVHGSGFVSETIEKVEQLKVTVKDGFIPSHCGIIIDNVFQEAIFEGFIETNVNRYPPEIVRVYELDVPDIDSGKQKFQELTNKPYGYRALVNGFLYTMTGINTDGDGEETGDCSEMDTRIIRACGVDILPNVSADCVTPLILMESIEPIARRIQ